MPQQRAHGVHLRMTGGAIAARRLDLFHDRCRRRHAEAAAAILFRDQRGEEARVRERRDEFARVGALAIEPAPIFARKLGAEGANRFADLREIVVRGTKLGLGHVLSNRVGVLGSAYPCGLDLSKRTWRAAFSFATTSLRHALLDDIGRPPLSSYIGSHENTSLERSSGVKE